MKWENWSDRVSSAHLIRALPILWAARRGSRMCCGGRDRWREVVRTKRVWLSCSMSSTVIRQSKSLCNCFKSARSLSHTLHTLCVFVYPYPSPPVFLLRSIDLHWIPPASVSLPLLISFSPSGPKRAFSPRALSPFVRPERLEENLMTDYYSDRQCFDTEVVHCVQRT